MSTKTRGVIAIFSRPVSGFANLPGKRVVRHLWVAFIRCDPPAKIVAGRQMSAAAFRKTMPGGKIPTLRRGEGIDLQNTPKELFGYWTKTRVKGHGKTKSHFRRTFNTVKISTARLHKEKGGKAVDEKSHQAVLPIYTGSDAKNQWEKIVAAAEKYSHAELDWDYSNELKAPADRVAQWPRSLYQLVRNNSTTFIKTIIKPVYQKKVRFKGLRHPGNSAPKKPSKALKKAKLVRTDEREKHRPT